MSVCVGVSEGGGEGGGVWEVRGECLCGWGVWEVSGECLCG